MMRRMVSLHFGIGEERLNDRPLDADILPGPDDTSRDPGLSSNVAAIDDGQRWTHG
jgi:hypothetical protein